ncbi:hypothetical protein Vafri_22010 [Volvox africanus]|nr:hypothetical protein Vafri_22010 [Volvox africanus]
MITKEKAVAAICAVTYGAERDSLMAFVYQQHEEQLHRWGIEESDGDTAIVSFVRYLAAVAGEEAAGAGPSSLQAGGSAVAGHWSTVPAAAGWSSSRWRAPPKYQLFWQALLELDITAGSFLNLPSNVYLLGRDWWGSSLLVRHCYRGLFDRMMELLHSSHGNRRFRFLITGTPGIGKSFFVVVLMGWLVQEMGVSTFLVEYQAGRYLFKREGTNMKVEVGSITDFKEELEDPSTW